jgi:nucleotide-binding universal stress UspA family protein
MTDQRTIVVGIDGSAGSEVAQHWAVGEARARKQPLRLVCAYSRGINTGSVAAYVRDFGLGTEELVRIANHTVKSALGQLNAIARDVEVTGTAVEGCAVDVLRQEAAAASLVVVGSRQLHATGSFALGSVGVRVAARAGCPVVVTRGPAGYPVEGAKVIAAVDASEQSDGVIGFALDQASRHGVALQAVLCWHPSIFTVQRWTEQGAQRSREQAEAWLGETLAGWREKYPDVAVTTQVVDEDPVSGLVAASVAGYLLVVGKSGRGATAGTLLGSVSQGILHHATCPVAVVATTGASQ